MATSSLAKQAHAVRSGLSNLEQNLEALLSSVGGSIGSAVKDRVAGPLSALSGHVNPLLALLGTAGVVGAVVAAQRGRGRPRKDAAAAPSPAPEKRGRARGGRGRKANLTAETIAAALKASGGNKSAAARALGVSQPTFYKYLDATKPAPAPAKVATAAKKPARAGKKSKKK